MTKDDIRQVQFLANRIEQRLKELKLTPRSASTGTGRGPDVIRNILRAAAAGKPYSPRYHTLALLADVLQTTPEWLMGQAEATHRDVAHMTDDRVAKRKPELEMFGERDFKIYTAVEGGRGEMVVDNEPYETVPRPWYMRDVRTGYGVVVTGYSMDPRYQPGDIVVVNPKLPLIRGKAAIFISDMHGDWRASLKTFEGETEKVWKVSQYKPEKRFELPKQSWQKAYRVVGTYEGA